MAESGWIDCLPTAIAAHVHAISRLPDFPRHLARFSEVHHLEQPQERVVSNVLAEQARKLAPDDPVVRHATAWSIRRRVPPWHFMILNDSVRNKTYQEALRRYVRPGMIVFEVGAGCGILAMMAAQAGAAHVYTCESEPLLVEVARENIARNGLSDRVTVIARHSSDVQVGRDLPRRADLFVAEIVDDSLLGEHVLAITTDVRDRLLTAEAILLPDRIELRGAVVGGSEWTGGFRAQVFEGLDVSALDKLGPSIVPMPGAPAPECGDEVTALKFDLATADDRPGVGAFVATAKSGYAADGFLQWIWLRFGEGLEYSNRPPVRSCWTPQLHVFPCSIPVSRDEPLRLEARYSGNSVRVIPADGE